MYIADGSKRVRKVTVSTGIITTIAGTGSYGYTGVSGDNGPATSANLYNPVGVAVDSAGNSLICSQESRNSLLSFNHLGNVYITDYLSNRIRKVTVSTGIITTFAGTGSGGYSGNNGEATSATLNGPSFIAVDVSGTAALPSVAPSPFAPR